MLTDLIFCMWISYQPRWHNSEKKKSPTLWFNAGEIFEEQQEQQKVQCPTCCELKASRVDERWRYEADAGEYCDWVSTYMLLRFRKYSGCCFMVQDGSMELT